MRSLMIVLLLATACGWKNRVKLLSDTEFDHYYALKVFMDEAERKTYLKLETSDERDNFLKELGLWDRFYTYEAHIRDRIVAGEVQAGWVKPMVYMPCGRP